MRHALLVLLWGTSAITPMLAGNERPQVEIGRYPYAHRPEAGWRVRVFADGSVRYEETAGPVKVAYVTAEDVFQWVQVDADLTTRVAPRRVRRLLARLRRLDLAALRFRYSAEHTFTHPTELAEVLVENGDTYTVPAEVTRVVTHGDTYRSCVGIRASDVGTCERSPCERLQTMIELTRRPTRAIPPSAAPRFAAAGDCAR